VGDSFRSARYLVEANTGLSTRQNGATFPPVPAIQCDYLVIGSGIAGLRFALEACAHGRVVIVTKRAAEAGSTEMAQGGVAAVLGPGDSAQDHARDTIRVGAGLCHDGVVDFCVREGPEAVRALESRFGVAFTRAGTNGELDLGLEGGHSRRRIAHVQDFTGHAIETGLLAATRAEKNIEIQPEHQVVDLVVQGPQPACRGAYVLDRRTGEVRTYVARATVLATGGAGKVYLYTSNPDVATGDGVAVAYRAGAAIANMEFLQFHPTCLYDPRAKSFLISEALRGEGAVLRLRDGTPFMDRYHADASLAPRDVVARAIDVELKRTGDDFVLLDATGLDGKFLQERFPNLLTRCREYGFDMRRDPIPVVPAAHYLCGGVLADEHARTTLKNLYAVGETACTGLHGACRLASNSLLEALVFARRAAADAKECRDPERETPSAWTTGGAVPSDEAVVVSQNWDEIRRMMWNYVGMVRSEKRLEAARRRIEIIREEIRDYYWNFLVTGDFLELRNIALVAHLIIESARRRHESRGLHYMTDHPEPDERFARDTVLRRGDGPPP
jgi:L-aspartate oxidase